MLLVKLRRSLGRCVEACFCLVNDMVLGVDLLCFLDTSVANINRGGPCSLSQGLCLLVADHTSCCSLRSVSHHTCVVRAWTRRCRSRDLDKNSHADPPVMRSLWQHIQRCVGCSLWQHCDRVWGAFVATHSTVCGVLFVTRQSANKSQVVQQWNLQTIARCAMNRPMTNAGATAHDDQARSGGLAVQ
jgi:hypothetical protein